MEKIDKVSQLLRRIDPMGLLANGAPEDEYVNEATEIVNSAHSSQFKDLDEIVRSCFSVDRFGVEPDASKIEEIVAFLKKLD